MQSSIRSLVPCLLAGCTPLAALAAESAPHDVAEVVITGTPIETNPLKTAQPISVLSGDDLHRKVAASLGETVSGQAGVSSTYYGPVASRPIIRGLSGYRVQMLNDGLGSMDASNLSDDHAVTIEAALAHQIEILRGPAALLYGSGGSGGVINVVNGRLPAAPPHSAMSGTAELRGDSALGERTEVGEVGGTLNGLFLHLDGYHRDTEDVRIPGSRFSDRFLLERKQAGAHVPDVRDRVPNSASQNWGADAGATYFAEAGSLGVAYDHVDTEYGLPTEELAFIQLRQNRVDLKGRLDLGAHAFKAMNLRAGYNDYTHTEFKAPGNPGTQFNNRMYELRVTTDHVFADGWRGTLGVQNAHQDFEAIGAEAFVPSSVSRTIGVFAFEERNFGSWTLQGGARVDNQKITPAAASGLPKYDDEAVNLSLGSVWHFAAHDAFAMSLTRTQRHPQATELYADGLHGALARVELGNPTIGKETGYTLDAALRHSGSGLSWNFGAFYNRYHDYIFIAPTGEFDPERGAPVFAYRQDGVDLYGVEAEAGVPVRAVQVGDLTVRVTTDYLRGKVRSGGDLPAMPPLRAGIAFDYDLDRLHVGFDASYNASQTRVAQAELPTDSFTLVSVDASYRWPFTRSSVFAFVRGANLLNEEARQHASPLKEIMPLPGRGVRAGLRMVF